MEYSLAHFGLYVKDPEVSKQFYMDVLGFKLIYETDPDMETKLIFLQSNDCIIELIGNKGGDRIDGYFDHLCLKVDDIEKAVEDLKAKGVEIEGEIHTSRRVLGGTKNVFFRGPDGEHLEIHQFL